MYTYVAAHGQISIANFSFNQSVKT